MYRSEQDPESWPIILAKALHVSSVMRLSQRHAGIIVSYHGVVADRDWQDWETSDMVAESVFREHLAFYRKHYNVLSLREMVAGLKSEEELPPRALAITFDDGYRNNLSYAVPALKEYELTATFFLTTGFLDGTHDLWWLPVKRYVLMAHRLGNAREPGRLGRLALGSRVEAGRTYRGLLTKLKGLTAQEREAMVEGLRDELPDAANLLRDVYAPLNWSEAKTMVKAGMEVGAHSVSHPILARESEERTGQEIVDSVQRIRAELGADTVAFSYPDGQLENSQERIGTKVAQAGCYAGLLNVAGRNEKGDDLYQLRRFPIGGHHTALRLELDLCGLRSLKAGMLGLFRGA